MGVELIAKTPGKTPQVRDIVQIVEELYPPRLAEEWDRVGLIAGRPDNPVTRLLVAVDPVPVVAAEALELGANMVLTHHPLYLRGTSFVAATDYKGTLIHDFIENRVALMNAHTNADAARRGVAEALAQAVGLANGVPFDPHEDGLGLGRIGELPKEVTAGELAEKVAGVLNVGPEGVLLAGDPATVVRKLAVSGGAGDSFLERVKWLGANAYVTADLRHHPASEHIEDAGPVLITASHFATEWPWVPVAGRDIAESLVAAGLGAEVYISTTITEPWTRRIGAK
ncbi:MAG: Nif3-like dinuclear metal center hexameric protein [Actinomycetaceae bacterium]|nr:Nif3-like dinuclear metal center hexameric protein [Actinomycetaceae bacterium]